jgi:hypothetical protein
MKHSHLWLLAALLTAQAFNPTETRAGTWNTALTTTNQHSATGQGVAIADSSGTTASLSLSTSGITSGSIISAGSASFTGNYTFTWQPSNSTDWPPAYTITGITTLSYASSLQVGVGSASTGDSTKLLSTVLPATGSGSASPATFTQNANTSTPGLTVTTTQLLSDLSGTVYGTDWSENYVSNTTTQYAYAASYFPGHFTSPYNVVLTMAAAPLPIQANLNFRGTSTTSAASVNASIQVSYAGN